MADSQKQYEIFQHNREKLTGILQVCEGIFSRLDMKTRADETKVSKKKVESEIFKVMIVGEFKKGKSTFINALLGEEILPADASPCTAIINEIKWGVKKKATLYFCNPIPEVLPRELPDGIKNYISRFKGAIVPPIEVNVNELNKYVIISKNESEDSSSDQSPYEKAELNWPFQLCKNGVEIIDSPGLNENKKRQDITLGYLKNADAILFVLSCTELASLTEIERINILYKKGFTNMIFICTRFDAIRKKDRESIMNHAYQKLSKYTEFGRAGVFFLSSINALDGKLENDKEMVDSSGINELEDALARYLTIEKSKTKLLQPAEQLKIDIVDAIKEIPGQKSSLGQSIEELENKADQAKKRLAEAEECRNRIVRTINYHRSTLRNSVKKKAELQFQELAKKIPDWINEMDLENHMRVFAGNPKKQANAIAEEINSKVQRRIEKEQLEWQEKVVRPMINDFLKNADRDIEEDVKKIFAALSKAKADFFHGDGDIDLSGGKLGDSLDTPEEIEWQARLVGAGYIAGGIAVAAGAAGLVALGVTVVLPIVAIPTAMLVVIARTAAKNVDKIADGIKDFFCEVKDTKIDFAEKKIKVSIGTQIAGQLKDNLLENSEKVAEGIDSFTEGILQKIQETITKEINKVDESFKKALQNKRSKEQSVEEQVAFLDAMELELKKNLEIAVGLSENIKQNKMS